jgi:hypothetical protein
MTCCTTVLVALAAEMRAVRIRHELLHDEGESYLMRVLEVFHIDLLAIREHLFALSMLRVHLRRRQAVVCTQTAGIVRRVCVCVCVCVKRLWSAQREQDKTTTAVAVAAAE